MVRSSRVVNPPGSAVPVAIHYSSHIVISLSPFLFFLISCKKRNNRGNWDRLTWCISRVQHININRDIDSAIPDAGFDLLYEAGDAESVEVTGGDDLKAAAEVVSDVAFWSDYGGTDSDVDGGVSD